MVVRTAQVIGAFQLGKEFLIAAGQQEQNVNALGQMLGSITEATKLLDDLGKFSMKTGFNKDQLEEYSKSLVAMGFKANELIPTFKQIGDIAAGVGKDKIPMLVNALGKMKQRGVVDSRGFMMLMSANVPIIEELTKVTGYSAEQLKKMGAEGKLTFADMQKALDSLTGPGGKFGNLMAKQATTLLGVFDRIKAVFDTLSEDIGMELLPIAKELANTFLAFMDAGGFQTLKAIAVTVFTAIGNSIQFVVAVIQSLEEAFGGAGDSLEGLAGIFKFVDEILSNFFEGLHAILQFLGPVNVAILALVGVLWLLIPPLLANPIVLILMGIIAIVAGITMLAKSFGKINNETGGGSSTPYKYTNDLSLSNSLKPVGGGMTFAPNTTVNLSVPAGTPGSQQQFLDEHINGILDKRDQSNMRDMQLNLSPIDYNGESSGVRQLTLGTPYPL